MFSVFRVVRFFFILWVASRCFTSGEKKWSHSKQRAEKSVWYIGRDQSDTLGKPMHEATERKILNYLLDECVIWDMF